MLHICVGACSCVRTATVESVQQYSSTAATWRTATYSAVQHGHQCNVGHVHLHLHLGECNVGQVHLHLHLGECNVGQVHLHPGERNVESLRRTATQPYSTVLRGHQCNVGHAHLHLGECNASHVHVHPDGDVSGGTVRCVNLW